VGGASPAEGWRQEGSDERFGRAGKQGNWKTSGDAEGGRSGVLAEPRVAVQANRHLRRFAASAEHRTREAAFCVRPGDEVAIAIARGATGVLITGVDTEHRLPTEWKSKPRVESVEAQPSVRDVSVPYRNVGLRHRTVEHRVRQHGR